MKLYGGMKIYKNWLYTAIIDQAGYVALKNRFPINKNHPEDIIHSLKTFSRAYNASLYSAYREGIEPILKELLEQWIVEIGPLTCIREEQWANINIFPDDLYSCYDPFHDAIQLALLCSLSK